MKVARILHGGGPVTAVVADDALRLLPGVGVLELLAADRARREELAGGRVEEIGLDGARLLSPILPASIRDFSVFEAHVEGAAMLFGGPDATAPEAWAERPAFYFSNPSDPSGPGDEIAVPPGCEALDLELEVVAVIGRPGRDIPPAEAGSHIVGYTIFNDWSARDIAGRELRMPLGFHKAKDFANTFGPWIVTPDELEPHRDGDRLDLSLQASINGRPLGAPDTLASMAWSFEELVAFSSYGASIAAGDVIGCGTCGNGCLMELWGRNQSWVDPPPLAPGDVVALEVEGIGTLSNTVVRRHADVPEVPPARRRARG
jgi:2-keto-4-pentenoate hydratase/2-oxohepta-3-ene-1,7-dioic acid hydratase in catechol pathway